MTASIRRTSVVAAALFNVGVNALAGAGVLFGTSTGAVSDAIPTGITPAGWAFSIWSVIFAGVLVAAFRLARPGAESTRYDALVVPFVAANVLTGAWQFPWLTGRLGLAAVVLVGILACLVWLYVRLDRLRMTTAERWMLGVPTALFLGWVCVAATLNITLVLVAAGWTGSAVWPPLVVLAVAGVGAALVWRTGDAAYAAALTWAFAGIWARNGADAPALTAALAAGVIVWAVVLVAALRRGRSPLPGAA